MKALQTNDLYLISQFVPFLCVCCILFAGLACRQSTDQLSDHESKVTVLYIGDERIFFQDYHGMEAAYLMFLPLVATEGDEYGEPRPVLAEHWEHSDDFRTWTFRLRKNLKWHDGVPVTAHDIKFTMDARQNPELTGGKEERYSVEVLDDHNWIVRYNKPVNGLDGWSVYYPKHLLEDLDIKDLYNWAFWRAPVGNGPYRYVRHIPKTMVEIEANPDYYKGKPRIERVVLKFAEESSLTELLSGNVDALTYVDRDILLKMKEDEEYQAYHWYGSRMEAIYWNHENPLFENHEIRKALTLAINRKELAEVLNYPDGVPLLDVLTTRSRFKKGQFPDVLPYDAQLASEILKAQGWTDSDDNGIVDKAGQEFSFIMVSLPKSEKMAVYIQDQYRKIGVHMEIQVLERNTTWNQLRAGQFEALLAIFQIPGSHGLRDARYFLENSPLGYSNPEMIDLLHSLENAIDLDKRDSIIVRIMPISTEDMPVTMLFPEVQTHIVHKRIKGLSSPHRPDPVWFMADLWIEDAE